MIQEQQHKNLLVSNKQGINFPTNKQYLQSSDDQLFSGFIYHPSTFPLSYKRIWLANKRQEDPSDGKQGIGLCFKSEKHLKLGINIEILIPIKNAIQRLRGQIVLVRKLDNYSEIGVWLTTTKDVHRARAIEQICHIETYLQAKKYQHGPFVNNDRCTQEWIDQYAMTFPTIKSKQGC